MDKIYLNELSFYGYHGVFKEEQVLGQRFQVDLILELDLKKAGEEDDLELSINYADAYNIVKEVVEGKPYKLVEAVAENIAQSLLAVFSHLHSCTVKVIKPDPPIPGHYKSVAIEIMRERENG
ncbi:dihydroneopterin aldolase [Alkalihalobacillus sp. 1P02AB]|uniref:dihydroneopterin aldolase n=1 Tax=Alkalihalobacillus sp. 1P02AB TaxID=3132260 RepID=UPI0039A6EE0E